MMQRSMEQSMINQTDVSLSVTKQVISAVSKDKNLILSPLSIQTVLALLAAGSSGSTREQLLSFLRAGSTEQLNSILSETVRYALADGSPFGGPRLSCANGVWLDRRFRLKPSFRDVAGNNYKSDIRNLDFQNKAEECRKEVNNWAERETKGLIKDVLPFGSVTPLTRLILANALYFKGAWLEKFNSSLTQHHEFFLLNGSSIQAPFMTSYKKQFIRAFDTFKVLRLSYERGKDTRQFSMYIFLPDAKDGLPSLIEKACSESGFVESHLPYEQVIVGDFRIPKFKIAFDFEASEVLKGQGLELPFLPSGDLTEMVDDEEEGRVLSVSSIFHKALIEVNEEGTEAAAVTTAGVFGSSYVQYELNFVADHPFMFVIREDTTGVVLFVGLVLDPLAG